MKILKAALKTFPIKIYRLVLHHLSLFLVLVALITLAVFASILLTQTGQRPHLILSDSIEASPQANELQLGPIFVDPKSSGQPWKLSESQSTNGVFTFRGNPTRSYYGKGPIPLDPEIHWQYPNADSNNAPLCSTDPLQCGIGWTGQPALVERDGIKWLIFGAYDGKVHFLNAETGETLLPPFSTNDTITTSITIDPDGYSLIYFGSQDNYFRVVSFDGDQPQELWRLDSNDQRIPEGRWGDDWDSSPLVVNDYLLVGGENSNFYILKLNRHFGDDAKAGVAPESAYVLPSWDVELLTNIGDNNVAIESSPVIVGSTIYFANSGGLIQGWDLSPLNRDAPPERIFRYWAGDEVDSSLVVDAEGFLYVGVKRERRTTFNREVYGTAAARADMVGQILKLDPAIQPTAENPDAPLVWSVFDPPRIESPGTEGVGTEGVGTEGVGTEGVQQEVQSAGVQSTLAISNNTLYATTNSGRLLAIDADMGEIQWEERFVAPILSSPIVVNHVLMVTVPLTEDNELSGELRNQEYSVHLRAYNLSVLRPKGVVPDIIWTIELGDHIVEVSPIIEESIVAASPIVWEGMIYVGTREGYMLGIGDVS